MRVSSRECPRSTLIPTCIHQSRSNKARCSSLSKNLSLPWALKRVKTLSRTWGSPSHRVRSFSGTSPSLCTMAREESILNHSSRRFLALEQAPSSLVKSISSLTKFRQHWRKSMRWTPLSRRKSNNCSKRLLRVVMLKGKTRSSRWRKKRYGRCQLECVTNTSLTSSSINKRLRPITGQHQLRQLIKLSRFLTSSRRGVSRV